MERLDTHSAKTLFFVLVVSQVLILGEPVTDIHRTEGETDVFIPCPFEFQPAPSIWRINKTIYTAATLPSVYSFAHNGLYINTVHRCMNQTLFQCIDTSGTSLRGQESSQRLLTVMVSPDSQDLDCTRADVSTLLNVDSRGVELDHRQVEYGFRDRNLALFWKIFPKSVNCSNSQIITFSECQHNTPFMNITTKDKQIILPLESLTFSGELVDVNISLSSDQPTMSCPHLRETLRFNVTETEKITVLLGSNNCTSCVEIDCHGGLNVAISNPDPSQLDILCPVYSDSSTCFSPDQCHGFRGTPFFEICEVPSDSQSSECKYRLCFDNALENLNNSRVDLFVFDRIVCEETLTLYYARRYIKSYEIKVDRASAVISIDATKGEICFSSSAQDCYLSDLTLYDVSIEDYDGNTIFKDQAVPESSCVFVAELLQPDHRQFVMVTQPYNDYIEYRTTTQLITAADTVLKFFNDSPRVNGSTITADLYFNQPVRSLQCYLTGLPRQDCSNGSVTFYNVPPRDERNRPYILRAVGVSVDGVRSVVRRSVRPGEEGFCLVHFINDGVRVNGNTGIVEFSGTGNFDSFLCSLDRARLQPCTSPVLYIGLSPGDHRLKVSPSFAECGQNRRPLVIRFTV